MLKWRLLLLLATCFVFFIAGYGTAAGQTVKFTKLELKKNQVYQGRKQLQLHYSFDIKGIYVIEDGSYTMSLMGITAKDFTVILWYFASGDCDTYPFERYQKIFDKEIRPTMEKALAK